ncbi:GroES chaperonin family [uncultured Caudovirales phage]|uniref:GroES chaperonin family n=1 Tax=uncultured Caudovirales phage TaxID=2100421 RepID=A0A6J7WXW8_9CAUD|nr:GroES chaperonin family [uncultured Caudovirales phage]
MSEEKKIVTFEASNDVPDANELDWAFPSVECGMEPFGGRVIIQLRRVKRKTAGRIILVEETKENEKWNNMIGKVIAVGPLAYKNRDTMQSWPEGSWAQVGDFVRVPKWGGDRWEIKAPGEDDLEDPVLFMTLNDHELIAKVTSNPLSFKAYV